MLELLINMCGAKHIIAISNMMLYWCHLRHVDKSQIRVMVFNATFNNISVISWRSVLLVEETGVPGENHQPAASYW